MLIAQIVGLVGIVLLLLVFQVNNRALILRIQIISCLVWSLYYLLVGADTAAGLIFLGAIRSYAFTHYRKHEWIYEVTLIVFAIATLLTWQDWTSTMALMGMILATTAMWQKNPRHIRGISLTVTPFWLTYNFLNHSYLGVVGDLITFSSVVLGICRFDLKLYMRRLRRANSSEKIDTSLV